MGTEWRGKVDPTDDAFMRAMTLSCARGVLRGQGKVGVVLVVGDHAGKTIFLRHGIETFPEASVITSVRGSAVFFYGRPHWEDGALVSIRRADGFAQDWLIGPGPTGDVKLFEGPVEDLPVIYPPVVPS